MAKQIDISNPFGDSPDITDVNEVDQMLYGAVEIGKKAKRDRIRHLDINSIMPDPMQPRRVVPTVVRQHSDGTAMSIITTWLELVGHERQERFEQAVTQGKLMEHEVPSVEFPWHVYLFNGLTERGWDESSQQTEEALSEQSNEIIAEFGYLEASLMKVIDLTASIHRDGLTNPISVAEMDDKQYIIETGERRWLAFHILDMFFDDKDYSKIPARLVGEVSIWRQAAENNARANLNAISKARQLAILLMDLYGFENFQQLSDFSHEQAFYAQVAEGADFPVPRGKGEQVINAMGLKNTVQIRQYRALLRLEPDIWEHADDTDMPERQIRDFDKHDTVTPVTPRKSKTDRFSKMIQRLDNELTQAKWNKLTSEERKARYATLESILHRLDAWGVD